MFRVPANKVLGDESRLIGRVVVNDQDLPASSLRHHRQSKALECLCQASVAIESAEYCDDLHLFPSLLFARGKRALNGRPRISGRATSADTNARTDAGKLRRSQCTRANRRSSAARCQPNISRELDFSISEAASIAAECSPAFAMLRSQIKQSVTI